MRARAIRLGQRGISLIEAVVAMAVMAFGMLAVIGLQVTLRGNGDIAKQRAEAVRIAQQAVEDWRAIAAIEATAGVVDFQDLVDDGPTDIAGINGTYRRTRTVTTWPGGSPPMKTLAVSVTWTDRYSEPQAVELSTVVAGVAPELAGSLALPPTGSPSRQPRGRNPGIPDIAKELGDGTSALKPPGAPGIVVWRFDNITGLVTLCETAAATTADLTTANVVNCAGNAIALSGFVRYHLDGTQPDLADALSPASLPPAVPLTATVDYSAPAVGSTACFTEDQVAPAPYTVYYCAIPVTVVASVIPGWSGRLTFGPAARIATTTTPDDRDPARVRICRYFETSDMPNPDDNTNDGDYTNVTVPVANQNYLAVNAGDGAVVFDCPTQIVVTKPVTKQHQP
ncbi:MAG: prepilin-type N-terminal cleavage/methylation domain-containing protein [Rubrivivax sp.]|nr:prepilin-type N-terminal cleavage/methylation domain-containing protein [Rubrivivax sp.]